MTSSTRFLAACALAMIATITPRAHAAGDDDKDLKVTLTLAEVRAFPEAYKRVPFELALLYHGPRDVYNPFFTLFEPSGYMNFAAWPADAPVFTREGFCDDYPFFYVSRSNEPLQKLVVAMKSMTWFTASCIVRSTAQDRPWIEVLNVSSAGPVMDPTDLRHLVRANVLAGTGEFDRSLLEFEMARMIGAPKRFIARCRSEEGRIALAGNQPERAVAALEQAWQWFPEDRQVAALLDRATMQFAAARQQQVASVPSSQPPPIHRAAPSEPPSVDPQAPQPPKSERAPARRVKPIAPVKSEPAKSEPKKPAPKHEPKAAPKAAPKAEPKAEPKKPAPEVPAPEPKVEPKAEPKVEPKADPEPTPAEDPDAEPAPAPDDEETDGTEPTEDPDVTTEDDEVAPVTDPAEEPLPVPEVEDPSVDPSVDPDAEPVVPVDPETEPTTPDEEPIVPVEAPETGEPIDPDAEPAEPEVQPEYPDVEPTDPDEEPSEEPVDPDAEPDDGGEPDDGAPAPEEPTTPPDDGSDRR